jgi:hypothetical protein
MPDWPAADRRTVTRAIHWTSILAALLLAGLASWLVYARTATNAGMTVVPALLTILLIDQVRRLERAWWAWLLALQGMLLLGAWAYAPVRFFYPLALVYFGIEFIFRRSKWREWLIVLIVTLVSLPVLLAFIDQDPGWNPADAINSYYNGRGEQVFALRDDPRGYPHFLRDADASSSPEELERQLIRQNAGDLARLLFDVDTKPALTDYWNQNGRLMPWFLSPLLVLGMLATVLRVFRSPESRLLNLMFWGFTLPLILTSKVHIGRLVVAMPLICIFAAIGLIGIAWGLTFRADRSETRKPLLNIVAPLLSLVLLVPLVRSTLEDLRSPIAPSWESRFAEMLEVESQQFANGVVWIGGGRGQLEVEEISLAAVSIQARGNYQFVNLAEGETPDPNDPRPALYFGAVTDLLANQETAAQICALPWVMHGHVDPLEGVTTVCESDQINRLP